MSLLEDCRSYILKGQESWESYFSKWELLAKQEEIIPEDKLLNECKNVIASKQKLQRQLSKNLVPSLVSRRTFKPKRDIKKMIHKKNKIQKKKKVVKVIEQLSALGNENKSGNSGNEQLEFNLRAIFTDILKENKNKWEIFSVLSQTFSQRKIILKASQHLVLNQQLALPFNEVKIDNFKPLPENHGSSKISLFNDRLFIQPQIFVYSNCLNLGQRFQTHSVVNSNHNFFNNKKSQLVGGRNCLMSQRSPISNLNCNQNKKLPFHLIFHNNVKNCEHFMKSQVNVNWFLKNSSNDFLKNNYLNNFLNQKTKELKPLAIAFDGGDQNVRNNINTSHAIHSCFEQTSMNICREKSFQNLFLHKRTGDLGLNMENSNFITPKSKALERNGFCENILHRKRKRPSKLMFFHNEDESESDDDQCVSRSPLILWENKKRKSRIISKSEIEADFDYSEKILDRVIR